MNISTKWIALGFLAVATLQMQTRPAPAAAPASQPAAVEQWGRFEIALKGPSSGNPFVDVTLSAKFTNGTQTLEVSGFYDGDGTYRIRFMPTEQGIWTYETTSNQPDLNGKTGQVLCTKPSAGNHGPVQVRNHFHFAYADGTPYFEMGTTSYDWTSQTDDLQAKTLATLKASPFNKIRLCVLPTRYTPPAEVPAILPFAGTLPKAWDFSNFNVAFFQNFDKCVGELQDLGIEADVIILHPYASAMGFAHMPPEADDRYTRYVVARLASYRNVWWSLANEFDHLKDKKEADWDRLFKIVMHDDPYGHLRGIQQSHIIYNKPWMTHASIQNGGAVSVFGRTAAIRSMYDKPIVFDEIQYEGDINVSWGRMAGDEMVHRFWTGTIGGTYSGHGETFKDSPWTNTGGTLKGKSPERLGFLRKIMEAGPADGVEPIENSEDNRVAGKAGEYYLLYFGHQQPAEWQFQLPAANLAPGTQMHVDILHAWEMTVTPVADVFKIVANTKNTVRAENQATVKLPGKPFIALRITRVGA